MASTCQHDVVIIGAGISGLCLAVNLIKEGRRGFVILEKGSRVGGTWSDNTYPGCSCDGQFPVGMGLKGTINNSSWTQLYPSQKEILAYLTSVAEHYGLYKHIRFHNEVRSCSWSDKHRSWSVETSVQSQQDEKHASTGCRLECSFLVSAVGQLNYPRYPNIPGLQEGIFSGRVMHSARWDCDYSYKGKRVAVVGSGKLKFSATFSRVHVERCADFEPVSGATAAQIIPELVKEASHVTVFQRSPNWVFERNNASISPFMRSLYRYIPMLQTWTRASMMDLREIFHNLITDSHSDIAETARTTTARKLLQAFSGNAETRLRLTPDFDPGCKRVILSDDYLPALSHRNCTLETRPIASMTKSGISVSEKDGDTEDIDLDLVILATGFRAVDHLHPMKISGAHGRSLSDVWDTGATALYGVTIEDMPNFGVLYGPNTNLAHNSLILQIESQARYISALANAVLSSKDGGKTLTICPRSKIIKAYNDDIQHRLKKTSFADSRCSSWFKDSTGLITTNWPGTAIEYQKLMSSVRWDDYELEGSGAARYQQLERTQLGRVIEETTIRKRVMFCMPVIGILCVYGWLALEL